MNGYVELLFASLSKAVLYGFAGLVLGISIIVALHKNNLLSRKNVFLKFITKTYYLLFPIVFGCYFWFAGSLYVTSNALKVFIDEQVTRIQDGYYEKFVQHLTQYKDQIPSNQETVASFLGENPQENNTQFYNYVTETILINVLEFMVGQDDTPNRASKMEQMIASSFSDTLIKPIKDKTNQMFSQYLFLMLIPVTMLCFGLLFIPCVEIIISAIMAKL